MLNVITLAITLSIDSIFVGVSYGIKGTKIPNISKLVICIFSVVYSAISIIAGNILANFIPEQFVKIFGALILAVIGLTMIIKVFGGKSEKAKNDLLDGSGHTNFIKPPHITIQILKNPDVGDIDKSGVIDIKESLLVGLALSIDALGAGIGSSLLGMGRWYVPFTIGIFQLLFLCTGLFVGKYFKDMFSLKEKYMSAISGIILIVFSIFKLM